MEPAIQMESTIETFVATKPEVEKTESPVDDFEKMILATASSATKKISAKKEDKVVDGIDIASVASAITGKKKEKAVVEAVAPVKRATEPKLAKTPKDKSLPVGNRDAKYGEPVIREIQPWFNNGREEIEPGVHFVMSNNMANIKEMMAAIAEEKKVKKLEVYIDSTHFFTQYHKMDITEPLQIEGVGKTYINFTFDGRKWSILPERQDTSFRLKLVVKE